MRSADIDTKNAAIRYFHDLILHGLGEEVVLFRETFFSTFNLSYADSKQREVLKSHLLGTAPTVHDDGSSSALVGLASYLTPEDVEKWATPFLVAIAYPRKTHHDEVRVRFMDELGLLEDDCKAKLKLVIKKWRLNIRGRKDEASISDELDGIEGWLDFLM